MKTDGGYKGRKSEMKSVTALLPPHNATASGT